MSFKHQFRQIKKFPDWVYVPIAWMMRTLCFCMRKSVEDPYDLLRTFDPPAVTVTWHNRLLFFPLMMPKAQRVRTLAVISASRDGQYIADLCHQFGVESLRGSTTKKHLSVLHGAVKALREKKYVSFTPDGPRGPRYHMSPGPIYLASEQRVPVIPIGINYSSYWELGSWDAFRIPKPWSRITVTMGKPIDIPENLTEEAMEVWRKTVEDALNEVSHVEKVPEK